MRNVLRTLVLTTLLALNVRPANAAPGPDSAVSGTSGGAGMTWLLTQTLPSITVITGDRLDAVGLEWEVTPILYSFGINRLVSPWKSFYVVPTSRFSGSIELVVSAVAFFTRIDGSHAGGSLQLLGHIPVIERGEHLCANFGIGEYWYGGTHSAFMIAGVGTLFGLVHFNARFAPATNVWMGSLEFRLF